MLLSRRSIRTALSDSPWSFTTLNPTLRVSDIAYEVELRSLPRI